MKFLMVCLGNICRSPLAEGILLHKAKQAGLNWQVESAGTGSWHIGSPPHKLSRKIASFYGIDISKQRCRQFQKEDLLYFDFIYVMDENNYEDVKAMGSELWNKLKVDLLMNELYPGENRSVPDPYFGTETDYHNVFDLLDKACDKVIEKFSIDKKQKSLS
ncbi:MAG: low molecular weight phosphotyrosine protein phosphatase [Bacteroidetes bacterium]|nr:low molecular weight phosphotyrosine protein phosphatase [Bacteroidota bacterium]MBS1633764.1 low molecular weight phosphotyrosine protein phosphatase [Bacteroidota bacterium]